MNVVQPIRDLDKVSLCYAIAAEHDMSRKTNETCWELLLTIGFNTSLRISDIVKLKVGDIRGKSRIEITAQKTGKKHNLTINDNTKARIEMLLAHRKPEEYCFRSRQKDPRTHKARPIGRQRAYQIINTVAEEAGIEERIGTHTLRKTFGYHYYQATKDVVTLQKILGHTARRDTLVYIGVIQDDIDKSMRGFTLLAPPLKRVRKSRLEEAADALAE